MILATPLGDWTDDLASVLSTANSYAKTTCTVAQGAAGQAVAAGAQQVLPGGANDVMNKANGYLQTACGVVAPSAAASSGSAPAPIKKSVFQLTPAVTAAIAANAAAARSYPTGTIATLSTKTNLWRIGIPRGLAGLSASPYVEVQSASSKPASATAVAEKDFNKAVGSGWHRSWWGMTAIGVGSALAAGTVGYFAVIHPSRARR
jgi:hypothetical protein